MIHEGGTFPPAFDWLIAAARGGDARRSTTFSGGSGPYLLSHARRRLPASLRGKCDDDDLVLDTLLEANRDFASFIGANAGDLQVWLLGIFKHNLKNLFRRLHDASKRAVDRELWLEDATSQYGASLRSQESVDVFDMGSKEFKAGETAARKTAVREALLCLPEAMHNVILLRCFESQSYEEIGVWMDCSPEAARKLYLRAMARLVPVLKLALPNSPSSPPTAWSKGDKRVEPDAVSLHRPSPAGPVPTTARNRRDAIRVEMENRGSVAIRGRPTGLGLGRETVTQLDFAAWFNSGVCWVTDEPPRASTSKVLEGVASHRVCVARERQLRLKRV